MPTALSPVATTAHDGRSLHAGGPEESENASSEMGRCVIPMSAMSSSERSDANASRTFAGAIENSVRDPPSPVGYCRGTSALFSTLSFESAAAAPRISPWSGAKAAT